MKFGSLLKKAREAKRLSQQEVADLLSVSQRTLSNIESDKSNPSIRQLALMGELYGLNIIELLSRHGIIFQEHQKVKESATINDHHYVGEIKELFGQLLKEKDSRIALLEEHIERLKNK